MSTEAVTNKPDQSGGADRRGMLDVAADPEQLDQVRMGLQKHKVTPRRVLDTAAGMQAATGVPGGGSGYSAMAIRQLSKTRSK